ncbi:L-seryl-tRNA(Sec) selenium transferase [Sulfurovum riftiae]|uniref:L-seryl-tRNA(Sec) selenium transferase n=1 Tax=Sulfurovum riftiae TaxID=1630136 RepID=A0A151CJD6_9BACT|nr:L-seryl-tRNA(Sec) selenium transferase [Sulfurovum riftiae]KYJ87652.1 L-seryl-tRNA(Sec) selenium transferase [Sulfurovum riftiae]
MQNHTLLRSLPKVDKFIAHQDFKNLSKPVLLPILRDALETLRNDILTKKISEINDNKLRQNILKKYHKIMTPSLQKVINATGVIVHTNLGRSPINPESFDKAKVIATSYNNLEYDLEKGKRGERYSHISTMMKALLGCEDVLVVNNNAAAVFLVLNTFARRKEVIVSRGELVEIGGSFRIPEVMKHSGAKLVEVGATNKTHLHDYEEAITERTKLLMKVHKSNYAIEGFTAEVPFGEIHVLAEHHGLIDYYDLGSGHIVDLPYGLSAKEHTLQEIMEDDPSLMSFSGDKLFGSVQAGIIVGKKELIDKLKKNQLLRMLRVDKVTLSILAEDVKSMLMDEFDSIPTLKMLFESTKTLRNNAEELAEKLGKSIEYEIVETETVIGGGSTPNRKIPSVALAVNIGKLGPNTIEKRFREHNIIGRIENGTFLLDLRTINPNEFDTIKERVACLISS